MNAEILATLKESSTLSLVNELLDLRKVIQYPCPKRQVAVGSLTGETIDNSRHADTNPGTEAGE